MQFLMYENGRFAIIGLMEFEPWRSESKMVTLCSELPLFAFLVSEYSKIQDDFRGKRLELRQRGYDEYKSLPAAVQDKRGDAWDQAKALAQELERRLNELPSVSQISHQA